MLVAITNTPRNYAWGSLTGISTLLGTPASGEPEAELWLGTHQGSPAVLADGTPLTSVLDEPLPFLLKVLAASAPLSLQAHPNLAQAAAGFARENAAGVPMDAPHRNYKDPLHKPELVYALSDEYHALCGFRPLESTQVLLARLGPDPLVLDLRARLDASLPETFEWLVSRGDGVASLVDRVVSLAASVDGLEFGTVGLLASEYPDDPAIVISLLLNRVVLSPGEALFLPAGNIHAYLSGLGIELMSASDNVLRCGLTPKHVDVAELLTVLDFTPLPVPLLQATHPSPGVSVYTPSVPDFRLVVVQLTDGAADVAATGPSVLLCTDGEFTVDGNTLARGAAAYRSPEAAPLAVEGTGTLFVATTGA